MIILKKTQRHKILQPLRPLLEGKTVFISASFAEDQRNRKPLRTTDAVIAFARKIFSYGGSVVMGGHPTITPLLLSIGKNYLEGRNDEDNKLVYLYQSKYFEKYFISEVDEIKKSGVAELIITDAKQNRSSSLQHMREQMLKESDPVFAVFFGGKDGIVEEFDLFHQLYPGRKAYPIGSTGGASEDLLEFTSDNTRGRRNIITSLISDFNLLHELAEEVSYPYLVEVVMADYKRLD